MLLGNSRAVEGLTGVIYSLNAQKQGSGLLPCLVCMFNNCRGNFDKDGVSNVRGKIYRGVVNLVTRPISRP